MVIKLRRHLIKFLALLFLLMPVFYLSAAKNAIGVRIARNSEHLSPSAWYDQYAPTWSNDSGGPTSISMAGYEAVSVGSCSSGKGETIYVNAANVDPSELYTNIYIISCPVGADQDTIDIFEQLMANWGFNVNVADEEEKEKIQRDTKRLSDLTTLKNIIENYRANISGNNRYPSLDSGTYEIGKSISYWQSWQKTLGGELKATLPEPTVGPGWGQLTGLADWAGKTKWPSDLSYPEAVVVEYSASDCQEIRVDQDSKNNNWCEGECSGGCGSGSLSRFAPNPAGYAKWPDELTDYTAVAQAVDYNNCKHLLVIKDNFWAEYTVGANCPYTGWTPVANLDTVPETLGIKWPKDIQNPDAIAMGWDKSGRRHIYGFKGNNYREYIDYNRPYIYQTVNQGLSYSICTYFETVYPALSDLNCGGLSVANYSPNLAPLSDREALIGKYFNYDISASDLDGDELSWSIDLGCGAEILLSSSISCAWGGSVLYATNTSQKNLKKIYGFAPDVAPVPSTRNISITVSDGRGGADTKAFNLTVIGAGLTITSIPPGPITIGDDYEYDVEAVDSGGYYPLKYSWSGAYPSSMNATSINVDSGLIFGTPTDIGTYNVTATAANTLPSANSQDFMINVNKFTINPIVNTTLSRDEVLNFFAKTTPEKVKKLNWTISCSKH